MSQVLRGVREERPASAARRVQVRRRLMRMEEAFARDPQEFASDLINQQLWCWGWDVRHPRGNLLVQQGFERLAPPSKSQGASIYRKACREDATIWLHSYGVFFGVQGLGGIFVPRRGFIPCFQESSELSELRWSEPEDAIEDPQTAPMDVRALPVARELCTVIASLETEYLQRFGSNERRKSVEKWHSRSGRILPADELATGWLLLRDALPDQVAQCTPTVSTRPNSQCRTF